MKLASCSLLLLLAIACLGMAHKKTVAIRFHTEAHKLDSDTFALPIHLHSPERDIYIEKVPSLHEGNIKAMYPYQASDGTWGAAFKLDEKGRIDLELLSTERKGGILVAIVATKINNHHVLPITIDKPIRDGIITFPHDLTEQEINELKTEIPLWPMPKNKPPQNAESR